MAHDQAGNPMRQGALPRTALGGTSYNTTYNQGEDQDPDDPNGAPGGTHDLNAESALDIVKKILGGFTDPDEQAQFVNGLSDMLQSDNGDGTLQITHMPDGNGNDRAMRSGRRGARDAVVPSRPPGQAQDAALARQQRSRNSTSFLRRWGNLVGPGKVSTGWDR
jgi:hypothetical protein